MKDIQIAGLTINEALYNLVDKEITPGTGITAESFLPHLVLLQPNLPQPISLY